MFKSKTLLVLLGTWILFCASCNNGSKVKIAEINNVEFEFEGPLYEGANTAQYLYSVDLKKLLEQKIVKEGAIKKAVLNSAIITADSCEDCYNFESIKSLVLSIVSDGEIPMKEIALLNPTDSKTNSQTLKLAEEADIADYFNTDKIYWVLDADISEDIDDNLVLFGDFKFELRYD